MSHASLLLLLHCHFTSNDCGQPHDEQHPHQPPTDRPHAPNAYDVAAWFEQIRMYELDASAQLEHVHATKYRQLLRDMEISGLQKLFETSFYVVGKMVVDDAMIRILARCTHS